MNPLLLLFVAKSVVVWAFLLWLCYLAGQAIHIWLRVSLAVASQLNSADSFRQYWRMRGPIIVARVFLETMAFIVFEYGSTTWFSLPVVSGSPVMNVALAGIFGYAADSLLDQVFAKVGLDKELPPRVDPPDSGGAKRL